MDLNEPIVTAYTNQDYPTCLSLLESAPNEVTSTSDMRILHASCLINTSGRVGEAHQILDKILEQEPSNGLAFYGKGLAFLKESNLEKSLENFTKAAELDTTGMISNAQVMKLKTEKMLKTQRKSKRLSGKKSKDKSGPAKPITCEICNRNFAQLYSLTRHKLIHSGERPHKCGICNFGFLQKSDLQRHMSVHNEVADFNCSLCDKKFKAKKYLTLHMLTHTTEKTIKCVTCGKTFRYLRLLKLHQLVHSKRQKYTCDYCGKIFVTKPSFIAHVTTHVNKKVKVLKKKNENIFENTTNVTEEIKNVEKAENIEQVESTVQPEKAASIMPIFGNPGCSTQFTGNSSGPPQYMAEFRNFLDSSSDASSNKAQASTTIVSVNETVRKEFIKVNAKITVQSEHKVHISTKAPENSKANTRKSLKRKSFQMDESIGSLTKKSRTIQNADENQVKVDENTKNVRESSIKEPKKRGRKPKNSVKTRQDKQKIKIISEKSKNESQNLEVCENSNEISQVPQTLQPVPQNSTQQIQNQSDNLDISSTVLNSTTQGTFLSVSVPIISPDQSMISLDNSQQLQEQSLQSLATRLSLGNLGFPPSLKIRPIFSSESRTLRNSISCGYLEPSKASFAPILTATNLQQANDAGNSALTLTPLNSLMSTPQESSAAQNTIDQRISSILSNPDISVAITGANPATKWSVTENPKVKEINKQARLAIVHQQIKLEPEDVPECDQNGAGVDAESSSNHDSLFSSENEHQNEWNLFFKSLMHDLSKMDDRQKRKFKQHTFMLIDDILQ